MRKRWIYKADGRVIEVGDNHELPARESPMIMGDIQPYQSMVTGEIINSRSSHREHLKSHNLVEIGNETKYLQPKAKELPPGLKQRIIDIANAKLR